MCAVAAPLLLGWGRQASETRTGLEEAGLAWLGSVCTDLAGQPGNGVLAYLVNPHGLQGALCYRGTAGLWLQRGVGRS